jgi:hypothetical protein
LGQSKVPRYPVPRTRGCGRDLWGGVPCVLGNVPCFSHSHAATKKGGVSLSGWALARKRPAPERSSPAETSRCGIARVSGTDLHCQPDRVGGERFPVDKAGGTRGAGTHAGREAPWRSQRRLTGLVQVCRLFRDHHDVRRQAWTLACHVLRAEQTARLETWRVDAGRGGGSVPKQRSREVLTKRKPSLRLSPACPNLSRPGRQPAVRGAVLVRVLWAWRGCLQFSRLFRLSKNVAQVPASWSFALSVCLGHEGEECGMGSAMTSHEEKGGFSV